MPNTQLLACLKTCIINPSAIMQSFEDVRLQTIRSKGRVRDLSEQCNEAIITD